MMKLENLCMEAKEIVTREAQFIKGEFGKVSTEAIEVKALNSLVSYVDKQAEILLVEQLSALLPESTFLTEEETVEQQQGTYRWIIDPLDGTTNFLHQLPCFAASVALEYQGKIVIGIVYEVNREECFYAWENGGAFLNEQTIQTSSTDNLADSLVSTGFPYYDYSNIDAYIAFIRSLMQNSRGIRRWGAAAVDLAYLAAGRYDAFFEYGLNPWDVAAGAFIVKEAGGKVTDFDGQDDYTFGRSIIATNGPSYKSFFKDFSKNFKTA